MPGKLRLPDKLQRQIITVARSAPEEETCGLLGGVDDELRSFYPVDNVDPDPARAFLMEPRGQVDAMREMRMRNETLRGIYHSHPDSGAEPSAMDRQRAAYPDVYYLIVSLQSSPPDLKAWYFDGHKFIETCINSD